jgi:MurNAc alpha-1-phosphate uridylyltransferase
MKAMILAAGLGTRLKPFTLHHPKALAVVNGKSLLQRNIEYLQSYGIKEVVVNVHHYADQIIQAIQENNGWGSTVLISDETDEVLETGGGVLRAQSFFEKESSILVMNADILTTLNLHSFMETDMCNFAKHPGLIATLAVTDRTSSRNLLFGDQQQLVGWCNNTTQEFKWVGTSLNEYTPKAFSGIQIIHDNYFKHIKLSGKFSLIDAYLSFDEAMPIMSYDHSQDILLDVGKPESLEKATALFK